MGFDYLPNFSNKLADFSFLEGFHSNTVGGISIWSRSCLRTVVRVQNRNSSLQIKTHVRRARLYWVQLVHDKDTFSTDDFMGEVEIDIQPLLAAARAYESSTIHESTQLGKWIANKDNTLVKDGVINVKDGKVRHEISLHLHNVEWGVLEIKLECIPLN